MAMQTRANTTREKGKSKATWAPPSRISTPEPPDGYKFRWIRRTKPGEAVDDVHNVLNREKQNYHIVTAEELAKFGGNPEAYQTIDSGKHTGAVINGDLVLTMIPIEDAEAREEYYQQRSKAQLDSVRSQLESNQNSIMPIRDSSRSSTKVGRNSFED